MTDRPLQLSRKPTGTGERERLVRRAKLLAWLGVGWHGVEAAIAVGAGIVAGSIALVGFGADSLVESLAGIILLWRFTAARRFGERGAQSPQAHRAELLPHSGLRRLRGREEPPDRGAARDQLGRHWTRYVHGGDHAPAHHRQGLRGRETRLVGDQERRPAEHALRLSLRGSAGRARHERAVRPVVG